MKKSLLLISVLVASVLMILTFSLAGCKTTATTEATTAGETTAAETTAAETTAAAKEEVVLTFSIWDEPQLEVLKTIAGNFKKLHPNITVNIESTPWEQYWMKMDTSITAGGGSDIFWMNGTNIAKYASNGVILPLNDRIESENFNMENYPESLVALYNYEGEQMAIPKDFDTIGLWYNKTLFDAAGIKYPDETWDWNTVADVAKKLTNASAGIYGITAGLQNQQGYYNTIAQAGGYVLSPDKKTSGYDKPEAITGLKFWTDLIKAGVSPTIQQMTDTYDFQIFESGKIGMIFSGSWMANYYNSNELIRDQVDVAVLPKGVNRATIIHGLGYCINTATKHPEEAWLFLQYLGGKEAAELQTAIPAYNGTQDSWIKKMPQYNLQVFVDMLDYAVPLPVSKETAKWWEVENKYFKQAWAGTITIEDAAKKVATEMNAILAAE